MMLLIASQSGFFVMSVGVMVCVGISIFNSDFRCGFVRLSQLTFNGNSFEKSGKLNIGLETNASINPLKF